MTGRVFNSRADQVADDANEMSMRNAAKDKLAQQAMEKLSPEELRALGTAFDATQQAAVRRNEALGQFLSAHADIYVDNQRNSDKIMAWLVAQGKAASFTFEDLEQALDDLAEVGQLDLNQAGVQARAEEARANPEQFVTEDDMYAMSMDELRAAAQQAAAEALARRPAPRATDGAGDGSTFNNPFGGNRHAYLGKGGRFQVSIEDSKSYEQLEWETKEARQAAERAAAEQWLPHQPTRNPGEDVLGPEVMNNLPGLRPRATFDPLCPPTSKIER